MQIFSHFPLIKCWCYFSIRETRKSTNKGCNARYLIDCRYMEPLTKGEYPKNMRALVGSRLPKFTKWQAKLVNGSFDFIGLNYYSSGYINGVPPSNDKPNFLTDSRTNTSCKDTICIHLSIISFVRFQRYNLNR